MKPSPQFNQNSEKLSGAAYHCFLSCHRFIEPMGYVLTSDWVEGKDAYLLLQWRSRLGRSNVILSASGFLKLAFKMACFRPGLFMTTFAASNWQRRWSMRSAPWQGASPVKFLAAHYLFVFLQCFKALVQLESHQLRNLRLDPGSIDCWQAAWTWGREKRTSQRSFQGHGPMRQPVPCLYPWVSMFCFIKTVGQ